MDPTNFRDFPQKRRSKSLVFALLLLPLLGHTQINTPEVTIEDRSDTEITGDVEVHGSLHVTGEVTGGVVSLTKNLRLTTSWATTGIGFSDLESGTYIIQVYVHDHMVGGGHFHEYYSGLMSWFSTGTNSPYADEITLHRAGHAPNSGRIYLRTKRNYSVDGGQLVLEIRSTESPYTSTDYVFKFKKLI